MKRLAYIFFLAALSFLPLAVLADEPLAKAFPMDDLSSTFLAKLQTDGDKEFVAIRMAKWKAEEQTRTYEVDVMVTEARTRMVKDKNGNDVEQTYTVEVPVKEQRTETYYEFKPQPPLKGEVSLAEIKAWNIKGKPLTAQELKAVLAKPTYLFGLSEEAKANRPPMDPFFASALRSDIIFVFSPKINDLFEQSVEYPAPTTDQSASLVP